MTKELAPGVAVVAEVRQVVAELWTLRMARGLAQAAVTSAAGLPDLTVSRLERDAERYFSPALVRHLAAYAAALGYSLRFVLVADSDETGEPR